MQFTKGLQARSGGTFGHDRRAEDRPRAPIRRDWDNGVMHGIVIELDRDETVAAQPTVGRGFRRWAVFAGAALVLLAMSGPSGPEGVTLLSVLTDPSGGKGIGALAEDVFVVEEPGGVAAYELDGRKRWSASAQHPAAQQDLIRVLGDLVVISSQTGGMGDVVTAFDAASGAQRWRLDGRLLHTREMRDDLIAVVHNDQILRVYDVRPLRVRWEISGVTAAAVDYETRSVVALFADATIIRLDLDSGVKRTSSRVARAVGGYVSVFLESGLVSVSASWTPAGPTETQLLSADSLQPAETKAADSPTGTRRVDLTGWVPLSHQDGSATAPVTLLAQPMPDDRTALARVQGQRLQVLGTVPFEIDHCVYHSPILVCSVPLRRLAVWRIAPDR